MIRQQVRAQLHRLLCAAGDDDLLDLQRHTAKDTQVVGHGTAQRCVAPGVVVVEHIGVGHAPVLVLQALPERYGKGVEVRNTGRERLNFELAGAKRGGQRLPATREFGTLVFARQLPASGRFGNAVLNKGAAADTADQIAFHRQLAQRRHHRVARQVQVLRQVAA